MIRSVIIAGSRTVSPTVEEIDAAIAKLDPSGLLWVPAEWTHVVSGRSRGGGADIAGEAWARARGKELIVCPVTDELIRRYGPYVAPKMRNREMAEIGQAGLIFWDGLSSGSADMAIRMLARRKPCEVIPWAPRRRARGVKYESARLAELIAGGASYVTIAETLKLSSPRQAAKIVAEFRARRQG